MEDRPMDVWGAWLPHAAKPTPVSRLRLKQRSTDCNMKTAPMPFWPSCPMPLTKHVVSKEGSQPPPLRTGGCGQRQHPYQGHGHHRRIPCFDQQCCRRRCPCSRAIARRWCHHRGKNKSVRVGQFSINVFLQWLEFCRRIDHQPI